MSTLCLPHVLFPQHIIAQQQMIEHLQQLHRDHPQLALAARMIRNTEVEATPPVAADRGVDGTPGHRTAQRVIRTGGPADVFPCSPSGFT